MSVSFVLCCAVFFFGSLLGGIKLFLWLTRP